MLIINKFILIVLDGVGIGALPDADQYGDQGSNTLGNTAKAVGGLKVNNMQRLGLGNIASIKGVEPEKDPIGAWGKMIEKSPGKDSTTGHWEIAGLELEHPFPTYPKGFPASIIDAFSQAIDHTILGNTVASGTEIIEQLGSKHLQTGDPIVYTSADSVFQIAAHEQLIPPGTLYKWCRIARQILVGEHSVGRVIARPFIGKPGSFTRTANRRDFSLEPVGKTVLDYLVERGITVTAIGKISDIFAGRGITNHITAKNNSETIKNIIQVVKTKQSGLVFANVNDFDSVWGHRNNYRGFAEGLSEFDRQLPDILNEIQQDDLVCITADHGCDPTTKSTDHSREYVPLLCYGQGIKPVDLGVRNTFADVAQTIADFYHIKTTLNGKSFLSAVGR